MARTPSNNNNSKWAPLAILGWSAFQPSLPRSLLAMVTIAVLFVSLWARVLPQKVDWSVGDQADRTIIARRTTVYADTQQTQELRWQAADKVEPVFRIDPQAQQAVTVEIRGIFARAAETREDSSLPATIDKVQALRERLAIQLSETTRRVLTEAPPPQLQQAEEKATTVAEGQMQQPIHDRGDDEERAKEAIANQVKDLPLPPTDQAMVTEIAQAAIRPNRYFDEEATERQRQAARQEVSVVRRTIHTGEVVIKQGEEVGPHHIDMFTALGLSNPEIDYPQALAILVLLALMVLGLWAFAARFCVEVYGDFGQLFLLCVVLVISAVTFRITQHSAYFEAIVLTAACAGCMLVALTMATSLAAATAAALGVLVALVAPGSDVRLVVIAMICAVIASFAITVRGSWSQTIAPAAAVLAIANPLLLLLGAWAFGLHSSWQLMVASAAGGVGAALLAVGATVVVERPLGLLTDLQLMELANPHQPILRRLLREAAGTYQHSIMVGSLAEQAAEAIGANGLLARTAAMYHDIGKLKRPYFFVENQFGADNPHDKLTPYMSALVLIAHDKDGAQMAEEIGLPAAVASAIPEHHGTSLIQYFYERALAEAPEGEDVSEHAFRYPGPKPRTRENAIIMLADVIEARVRTLDDLSPSKIAELVDDVVDAKIQDRQLDECPLTYADISAMRQSFVATLNSMFHQRIKYPDQLRQEAEELAERYRASLLPAEAVRSAKSDSPVSPERGLKPTDRP